MNGAGHPSLIRPAVFSSHPGIVAGMSTRQGGVSPPPFGMNLSFSVGDEARNVEQNRALLLGAIGATPDALAIPLQVHSATVRVVRERGSYPDCDGLLTQVRGIILCVSVADCVPLLVYDPVQEAVGAIHAGWRGTAAGIVQRALTAMSEAFGTRPSDLRVSLGPSARGCCYQVGPEVASRFRDAFVRQEGGASYLDLNTAITSVLMESGVSVGQMEVHPSCTISESEHYHSYRREGPRSGRMMAFVGLL